VAVGGIVQAGFVGDGVMAVLLLLEWYLGYIEV
jgi:hypothetical protein